MSAALRIAAKDLRLRMRDRSFFILGILTPLALAFVFNAVFGSSLSAGSLSLEYGFLDDDQSQVSTALGEALEGIEAQGLMTLTRFSTDADARAAVDDGDIDAYFRINEGLGRAVVTGKPAEIDIIGDVDAPTSTQIAASIAEQFSEGVAAAQLSVATSAALIETPSPEDLQRWATQASQGELAFLLDDSRSAETRQLDGTTFFAAGMAVFFLFFTVQFGVSGLLEEERDGTLARLMAAPISRISVVLGKAILAFGLGVISMIVLIVATSALMGATWGSPVGVLLLVIAGVLSAVAIMGLVASVAKTPDGAGNLGSIIAVTLGLLGGTFFPLGRGDDLIGKLSFLTPHAWFMRGLGDLAGDASWTAALPSVAATLVFAIVFGSVAWVLLSRRFAK